MLEKEIEKKLTSETKKRGGLCLKFVPLSLNGVPDRLVFFPKGKFGFIELKAPGKKLRPQQEKRKRQLEALGFLVFKVDTKEMIGGILDAIQSS